MASRNYIVYSRCFLSPVYYNHVITVITFMASIASLRIDIAVPHWCITVTSLQWLHSWLLQPFYTVIAFPHWCIAVTSLQWLLLQSLHIHIAYRHCIACSRCFVSPLYYSHAIAVITFMASTAIAHSHIFPHWCITIMSLQSLLLKSLHIHIAYTHCIACSHCSHHQYITITSLQSLLLQSCIYTLHIDSHCI